MLDFSDRQAEQMRVLQAELTTVLLRAKSDRVEAAVAAFALVRCARILLDQYSDQTRVPLLDVVEAFLRHETVESKLLVL
jgi:hypothetical protein